MQLNNSETVEGKNLKAEGKPGEEAEGEEEEKEQLPDNSFEEDGSEAHRERYQQVLKAWSQRNRGEEAEPQWWILDDVEDLEEEDSEDDKDGEEDL